MLPEEKTPEPADAGASRQAVPFSSNEVRLSPRQWWIVVALLALLSVAIPAAWQRVEPFAPGPTYRIPYSLGEDYWLYNRYCRQVAAQEATVVLGDSVVWGHYVTKEETLSYYLGRQGQRQFVNLGVDGVHPAAMAGLIEYYAGPIAGNRVLLHCNPLWMSSKQHDLQVDKEFAFQHPRLVPQFLPAIPCYKESLANKLSIVVDRNVTVFGWANHLRAAYFGNSDLQNWTLEHPYRNPLGAVTLDLPSPDEQPNPPPGDQPWTRRGIGKFSPPWVDLDRSFQWQSFRRAVEILQGRGNRVFVLVGPFNEHMLKDKSLRTYQSLKAGIAAWLTEHSIPHFVAAVLPSDSYADASHPLGDGYAMLAKQLWECPAFQEFSPP